jgi:hypothetical protein
MEKTPQGVVYQGGSILGGAAALGLEANAASRGHQPLRWKRQEADAGATPT